MAFEQIRLDRQLSRLELALAIILIGVCVAFAINRMEVLAAVAEATALDITVRNLRAGTMGFVGTRLLRSDYDGIAALSESNPVGVVIDPPAGYIGSITQADPDNIRPGQWYYDQDNGWLAYHVVNTEYLENDAEVPGRIRIALKLNYNDLNGNDSFDAGTERPAGISVHVLDTFTWNY